MKRFTLLLFCLCFSGQLYAITARPGAPLPRGQKAGFSFSPFVSLMGGYSDELVYDDSSAPYPYMSQLTWEIRPAVVAGSSFSLQFRDRASLNLAVGTAVNKSSGEMTDRDWLYEYFDDVDTEWTHESVSDIDFNRSLLMDINAAFRVYKYRYFRTDLLLGYKYMEWGWTDEITSITYPNQDLDYLIGTNGIDYNVEYRIPYAGMDLTLTGRHFSGGTSLLFSPLVSAEDHDHHILRGLHFYDSFSGGTYLGASVFVRYYREWFSLSLACDLDYIPEIKGDTTIENEFGTETGYYPNDAGVKYLAYAVTLALEFNL